MMNTDVKDPVCGMTVNPETGLTASHLGRTYHFCSDLCLRKFTADPSKYAEHAGPAVSVLADPTRRIAYFSMEIAVDPRIPTYSGGLGILAGDSLRSCADLRLPVVAVTLLYTDGYFDQQLDSSGKQRELPVSWEPSRLLLLTPVTVSVRIENRSVAVRAWQYVIMGAIGYPVPVVFLDTNVEDNVPADRALTASLYGGDEQYRLAQEIILGIGGVRMLRALGYTQLDRFHMNEGHASLLTLELLRERGNPAAAEWDYNSVRSQCVFTTHTPVAAGHDRFSYDMVQRMVSEVVPSEVTQMLGGKEQLNMTLLGLNLSHYVNGVAKRHKEISQELFPGYTIDSVTNGVHSSTWTCESFTSLYDHHMPGWRNDPAMLRYAIGIPKSEIWQAHSIAKRRLLEEVQKRADGTLNTDSFTIGFARRATQYKRADLVFADPTQLLEIARTVGSIQFIFAGKAHPKDEPGKELIRRVFQVAQQLQSHISIVYLENYDVELAQLITAGVDLWLNTPLRPLEASGTSGMKAAHNGVPSFSVMDGWWIEGHIEGVTGWSIGPRPANGSQQEGTPSQDVQDLYHKLRTVIVPVFYGDREKWTEVMRQTIAFNASFFNTHRMVQQYAANAYL